MKSPSFVTILSAALMVIGLGLLVICYQTTTTSMKFQSVSLEAKGVVTDLIRSTGTKIQTYAPSVRFTDNTGQEIEFTSNVGANPPDYKRGEEVTVMYLPGASADAKIKSFSSLWMLPLISGVMGSLFAFFGLIIFGGKVIAHANKRDASQFEVGDVTIGSIDHEWREKELQMELDTLDALDEMDRARRQRA